MHLVVMVVGVDDGHGDVRLALGNNDLVCLVAYDRHGLALEPGVGVGSGTGTKEGTEKKVEKGAEAHVGAGVGERE